MKYILDIPDDGNGEALIYPCQQEPKKQEPLDVGNLVIFYRHEKAQVGVVTLINREHGYCYVMSKDGYWSTVYFDDIKRYESGSERSIAFQLTALCSKLTMLNVYDKEKIAAYENL